MVPQHRTWLHRTVVLAAAVAALAALPALAHATPPKIEQIEFEIHRTDSRTCSFAYRLDWQVKGMRRTYYDQQGDQTRIAIQLVQQGTLTNLQTGGVLDVRNAKTETVDFEAGTMTQVGTNVHLQSREGGLVLRNAGVIVFGVASFDPRGAEIVFEAGDHPMLPGDSSAICSALASA